MTVLISPVYTGAIANDGTGDQLRTGFDKVNSSFSNVATAVSDIQNTYANTSYGVFANITVTNRVIGRMDFYTAGSGGVYVDGSPVATSAASFTGGNVGAQSNFQAATSSTSSTTGAVVITGGLGVGGKINSANDINSSGVLTVTNSTDSSSTGTGGIVTSGGLGVARNAYIGSGLYVSGAISGAGFSATGTATFTSATASTGYSSGAVIISGGMGIAGNLNVNGATSNFYKDVVITGNLTAGNIISTTSTLTTTGGVIYLQNGISGDNGYDAGIEINYYLPGLGAQKGFLGWERTTGNLKYYSKDATSTSGVYSGTAGAAAFGSYYATNTTPSTSTTSGALQVAGGAGVAGNLHVGNITTGGKVTGTIGNITTLSSLYPSFGTVTPFANVSYNLGSTSNYWNNAYISSINAVGITVNSGKILPGANVVVDIGSTSAYFNNAYINSINAVGITVNSGHILPGANTSANIGSSTAWFSNVHAVTFRGTSVSAQYADLAEKYLPDADYAVGTVVCVGGAAEITASTFGQRAIGAVSGNPAYKMNSDLEGGVYVALKGRVPVQVVGTVRKGDNLIATDGGCAISTVHHSSEVFAVALASSDDTGIKLIEAIIL